MRFSLLVTLLLAPSLHAQDKTLNSPRGFPKIESRAAWESRAKEIREQILVSCGLYPLPEKSALKATVFGKTERDGYTVEKVHLQPYPGFYLAGNLYRPLNKGTGPFPAILNPHGHWDNGRLADEEAGSIRARCISFARQGMIAFTYDMVGYNDTTFAGADAKLHRAYGTAKADQLWGINLMGLQLWNSIRALDFLESLPDVDAKRLACTGESGGGTQTFLLGAVDDRLALQVPVVMVSHSMQGGCNCENAPGLRVNYSNMEIAAAAAPRPQLIVGATGDWTKTTLEVEGPAIAGIYKLFDAADRFQAQRFDFGHNYNQTSREAVYEWLGKRLLDHPDPASFKEQPYVKVPDEELRVFPDGKLPADALTMEQFIAARKEERRQQWQKLVPADAAGLERFKKAMLPVWRHCFQLSPSDSLAEPGEAERRETMLVKVTGDEMPQVLSGNEQGVATWTLPIDEPDPDGKLDEFSNFYSTYNRTRLQQNLERVVRGCHRLRGPHGSTRVVLSQKKAGILVLLAAPAADAVVVDCKGFDPSSDDALLAPGYFAPGLRCIGGLQGAAMLAAPHPLLLFNTQGKFPTADIEAAYRAAGASDKLQIFPGPKTRDEILKWATAP